MPSMSRTCGSAAPERSAHLWMLQDSEYCVLKKYEFGGSVVDENDFEVVERLVRIGLMAQGFGVERNKEETAPSIIETARLTEIGRMVLRREKLARSRSGRILRRIASIFQY